jgi:hypothetical protein
MLKAVLIIGWLSSQALGTSLHLSRDSLHPKDLGGVPILTPTGAMVFVIPAKAWMMRMLAF